MWRRNVRFGGPPSKLSNAVAHRAGCEWCADETRYRSMGKGMWRFGAMYTESRFAVHHMPSPNKFGYDTEPLFAVAIRLAGKEPDACMRKRHADNNMHGRFNGTVKDRIRRVRGFRSELPALHVRFPAYYNPFRPRSGVGGKTPRRGIGRYNRMTEQVAHGHTACGPVLRVTPWRA